MMPPASASTTDSITKDPITAPGPKPSARKVPISATRAATGMLEWLQGLLAQQDLADVRVEHPPADESDSLLNLKRHRHHTAHDQVVAPAADALEEDLHCQLR